MKDERVRVTVLEPGDKVLVQLDEENRRTGEKVIVPRFSRADAPARAQWMTVRRVQRRPGQRTVTGVVVKDRVGGEWVVTANSMFAATRRQP